MMELSIFTMVIFFCNVFADIGINADSSWAASELVASDLVNHNDVFQ